ncbi:MAG: ATP-binding protein [Ignavibacteriae bacterium]|nr:ATP-binding protein [Ignavibacteriota bacterium]
MNNWKETKVWKKLVKIKGDEADRVRGFLVDAICMDRIETILNKAGTSPKDFALHDADHSFRVAERMWEIIPANTKKILSEYELAFLLLSAYLHDIGMTPEYMKVKNHFTYITTNDKTVLSEGEVKEFQNWLDEGNDQFDIETSVIEDTEKAEELITFYCRHKHNDWSEDWIRTNLKDNKLGYYTNYLDDLVNICRSHHDGLDELKQPKFNPQKIHGKIIHKRYIAICLRLADVIEIDPERAPEVLIKHRSIIEGSLSHWLKEKFTSVDIDENHNICVTANPTRAFIHKAIFDVADQIEQETNLCNTLISEIPLKNISPSNNLKHEWNIHTRVHREIKSTDDYEYIDGTFKPNSEKLLQLLAGTELYGNPLLAIRELIQNSFDAIKVQIAYKVLEEGLTDDKDIEALKKKFNLELSVSKEGDDYWIICKDNGVGMDKEIIKKCFLVGGANKRHELKELERKCNKIGHNIELTGQFGIGVLSYFMIADKLLIQTKKSYLSGNREINGWEFEINGISDFGELRSSSCNSNGTIIKLRIKQELINQIESREAIVTLLTNILSRVPCNFNFIHLNNEIVSYLPGWCKKKEFFTQELVKQFSEQCVHEVKTSQEFLPDEIQAEIKTSEKRKLEIGEFFLESIELLCHEGKLQNNNGYFRIHIPIFKNKAGDSLGFFFEKINNNKITLEKINHGFLYFPEFQHKSISWKGVGLETAIEEGKHFDYNNCFIEIDLTNEKSFHISTSRLNINSTMKFDLLLDEIKEKIKDMISLHKSRFTESKYSLFNYIISDSFQLATDDIYWTFDLQEKDTISFEKVKYPLIFDISYGSPNLEYEYYNLSSPEYFLFFNERIYRLCSLLSCGNSYSQRKFEIDINIIKFDKAVFYDDGSFRILFLILDSLSKYINFPFEYRTSNFPPEWKKLFCFRGVDSNEIVLNTNSPYFKYINYENFVYIKNFFKEKKNLHSEEGKSILEDRSKSFCFMLYLISINDKSYWNALTQNHTSFVKGIWTNMFGNEIEILYFFHDDITDTYLTFISINGWVSFSDRDREIGEERLLPLPEIDWRLVDTHEQGDPYD